MRCVSCGARSKGPPERHGFRCPRCGHQVALSKHRDGFNDRAVNGAVTACAAEGRLRCLPEHPAYELVRRTLRRARWRRFGGPLGLAALVGAVVLNSMWSIPLLVAVVVGLGVWWRYRTDRSERAFAAVQRFLEINPSDAIIDEGTALEPGDAEVELAIATRRALVCQHERYARFLLANQFHLEHACPVVGPDPARSELFPGLVQRMRESADATVLVLHDLTPGGASFARRVRSRPQWFGGADGVQVIDLGLNPGQENLAPGLQRRLQAIQGALGAGAVAPASARGRGTELTALRPASALQMVAHSVAAGVPLMLLAAEAEASRGGAHGGDSE